jgi:uncharacterized phage-like protein YoqJ
MIVGVTGHRPPKCGNYEGTDPLALWIKMELRNVLRELQPLYLITGMALGVDQWTAEACVELNIPFIAAVPFPGQAKAWPPESQEKYQRLIKQAREIVIVNDGIYENWKMQARNEWIVDHINVLIAVFDGSPGGTANTVNYADRIKREKRRINPNEFLALRAATGMR